MGIYLVFVCFVVMGRRKQSRPHRSGGAIVENSDTTEPQLDKQKANDTKQPGKGEFGDIDKPLFVEVNKNSWVSDEHLDISELVLKDLNLKEGFSGFRISEDFYHESKYSLRFRVCNVNEFIGRIKLGHWPLLSSSSITLEFVEKCMTEEDMETHTVILSGSFDGPDEGVTGLVHLANLELFTLRPVLDVTLLEDMSSVRVRVEILKSTFDACESILENSKKLWKRSMMNVMAWLRPEVMTSEARYGVSKLTEIDVESMTKREDGSSETKKLARFDVAGFYEAIKPSR